jgi:hypothetical protein
MNDDSVSVCVSKIVALASSFLLALTSLIVGRSLGSSAVLLFLLFTCAP